MRPRSIWILARLACSIVCLVGLTFADAVRGDAFVEMVLGLEKITLGAPGAVFGADSNWVTIVGGDDDSSQPSSFIMARTFAKGRVVAVGHDGMLGDQGLSLLDNGKLMSNIVYWLRGTNASTIQYTTGHGEWASGLPLQKFLTNAGFTISGLVCPMTTNSLAMISVLIVGNAWNDFTANEIEAVRQFVAQGGGLLMAGLGWSWGAYHPGKSMEDYPMTQMAGPYGGRWLRTDITDPTNQTNGAPIFHTFYPNAVTCTPAGAMAVITNAHAAYGTNLPAMLETNVTLRTPFVAAHAALAVPSVDFPTNDPLRLSVSDFYLALAHKWPGAYARTDALDQARYPTTVRLRERLWRTLQDCAPLTLERKV